MRVTIQYQERRKSYAWKTAFPGEVLFADGKIILVRACGSHSEFDGDGHMRGIGWKPTHSHAANLPNRTSWFRLHPNSLKRIKTARTEMAKLKR